MSVDRAAEVAQRNYVTATTGADAPTPVEAVEVLRVLEGVVQDAIAGWVAAARAEGLSWAQIAPALGTSKQAAQQRYGA